jgi:hypothetical protein
LELELGVSLPLLFGRLFLLLFAGFGAVTAADGLFVPSLGATAFCSPVGF